MTNPSRTHGFHATEVPAVPHPEAVEIASLRGLHSPSELFTFDRDETVILTGSATGLVILASLNEEAS